MINIGAYDFRPVWKSIYYTTSEEALNIAQDLKESFGTHWGTFVLSTINGAPVRFKENAENIL